MIQAIRLAKSAGAELIILSDANSVFIEVILKAYGCEDVFSEVVTNPGWFEENGRLSVRRWVPAEKPHGCGMCSLNMCKGFFFFYYYLISFLFFSFLVIFVLSSSSSTCSLLFAGQDLARYLEGKQFDRKIYIGDSKNDHCPSTRLSKYPLPLPSAFLLYDIHLYV